MEGNIYDQLVEVYGCGLLHEETLVVVAWLLSCIRFLQPQDFPGGSDGNASAYNVGDPSLIPGLGRSSGEVNGNPLQYSCLENPMDSGA